MDVRIELVADLSVLFDAELVQRFDELVHVGLERPGDIAVVASELDLVEHGNQSLDDLDRAAERRTLTFAVGPHPVGRIFGVDALEVGQVSRCLRTRFGLGLRLDVLETRGIGRDVHTEVAGIGRGCLFGIRVRGRLLTGPGRGRLGVGLGTDLTGVRIDPALVTEGEAWLLGRLVVALDSHYFFSSSSSSTTSASTTSSSALASAAPSPAASAPSAPPCWL